MTATPESEVKVSLSQSEHLQYGEQVAAARQRSLSRTPK